MVTSLSDALNSTGNIPPVDASQLNLPANDAGPKKPSGSSITDAIAPDVTQAKQDIKKIDALNPPPPPQFKQAPKMEDSDPVEKGYISAIGIAGAIGSMFTRTPMVNSMKSAAAAIGALKQGDLETYNQHMDAWKIDNENIKNLSEYQQSLYKDALDKAKTDLDGGMALLQAHAAAFKDDNMQKLAEQRNFVDAQQLAMAQGDYAAKLPGLQAEAQEKVEKQAIMLERLQDLKKDVADAKNDLQTGKITQDDYAKKVQEYKKGLAELQNPPVEVAQTRADATATAKKEASESKNKVTLTPAALAQKVEILHKGGTYADAGLSQRPNNNPDKDAVDNALAEKYPDFDREEAMVSLAGKKQEQRTESSQAGRIKFAANSLDQALPLLKDAASKINLKNFTNLNQAENYYREHTSDKNMEEFLVAVQTALTDYSTLIARNGLRTDATDSAARKLLSENMGRGSIDGFIEQAGREKSAQLKATAMTTGRGDQGNLPTYNVEDYNAAKKSGKLKSGDHFLSSDGVEHVVQ